MHVSFTNFQFLKDKNRVKTAIDAISTLRANIFQAREDVPW